LAAYILICKNIIPILRQKTTVRTKWLEQFLLKPKRWKLH